MRPVPFGEKSKIEPESLGLSGLRFSAGQYLDRADDGGHGMWSRGLAAPHALLPDAEACEDLVQYGVFALPSQDSLDLDMGFPKIDQGRLVRNPKRESACSTIDRRSYCLQSVDDA